jgi:DNA-binding response OmpR family regulator
VKHFTSLPGCPSITCRIRLAEPVRQRLKYGDADTERKALAAGAEALLTKPIDFDALRNRIDSRLASAV